MNYKFSISPDPHVFCFSIKFKENFNLPSLTSYDSSASDHSPERIVYLNCNLFDIHSNASRKWTCKHKSHHKKSEHKIMSNKHHLREFRVAFYVFMVRFFFLLVLSSRFDFGPKKKKKNCKQNEWRERNKRRTPTQQKNWIITKTRSTDMKCWWHIKQTHFFVPYSFSHSSLSSFMKLV